MKKKGLLIGFIAALLLVACDMTNVAQTEVLNEGIITAPTVGDVESTILDDSYIVVFKEQPGKAHSDLMRSNGARVRESYDIIPAYAIKADEKAAKAIANDPTVAFIEKEQMFYATSTTFPWETSEVRPWGVDSVNAPSVWSTTTGENVKVAVLDTGIDYNHPDLAANYKGGYDAVNKDDDPFDGAGHGTHCSGTIGAISNNGYGVDSVAYNVDLYAVKVLSDEGSGTSRQILRGLDWAVKNDMDIASMSLGGGNFRLFEYFAYKNAARKGLLVICASGNDSATTVGYPSKYDSTMSVGAIDSNNEIADFSNTGEDLDIVAPGVKVLSTVPMGTGQISYLNAGSFNPEVIEVEFAPNTDGITGNAVYCALGENTTDFPAEVNGNIALIQRGNISFAEKVLNAMAAGAIGVIIYNNEAGEFNATLGEAGDYVPAVSMSMEDGETLKALGSISTTIEILTSDFDYYNGTSMATPHVSAVAALVKGANPSLTNEEIKQILKDSATDLGSAGWDSIFGWGLVNAEAAVEMALNY